MMRTLPLLLLLAACGGGIVNESLPRGGGADGDACREEAVRDPEVRRIAESYAPSGNLAQDYRVRAELREALPRAYRACMIRRGALPAGGVETVRRPGW